MVSKLIKISLPILEKEKIASPTASWFATFLYSIRTRTSGLASQPFTPGRRFLRLAATFQLRTTLISGATCKDFFLPRLDAEVGLMIDSNVPKALDPLDIKHSQGGGPYASRARVGWAVNGPLGRRHQSSRSSTFVA